jgi:hypothetical protein
MLDRVLSKGAPKDDDICYIATLSGSLESLQMARAHGCVWDSRTYWKAAQKGYMVILQWALANGCPRKLYIPKIGIPLSVYPLI